MFSCIRPFLVLCTVVLVAFIGRPAFAGDAETQSMGQEMARLLPEGVAVIAYTPSLSKMTSELTALVKEVNPQAAGMLMFMGPETLLKMQLNTKQKIRSDMPVAIAVAPRKTLQENPTNVVIFAIDGATPENVKVADKSNKLIFLEGTDWVAMTTGDAYSPQSEGTKTPAIAAHMLPGMLTISFDQAMLRTKYGDALEKVIAGSFEEGNDASDPKIKAAVKKINDQFAAKLANGFDRWDYGVNFDPSTPGFTLQYTPATPSWILEPSSGLETISSHLASELPMQMVVSKDFVNMLLSLGGMFLQAEGTETNASVATYMKQCKDMIAQIDGGVGLSVGMSGDGMNMVKAMRVKDVKTFLGQVDEQMKFLNESNWGIAGEAIPVTVGAETSRAYRLKIDMDEFKKAFPAEFGKNNNSFAGGLLQADGQVASILSTMQGPDGLIVRMISKDDWVAIVIGDAKLLGSARRALAQGTASNTMVSRAFEQAYSTPVAGMSMDVRSFLIGVGKYAKANPSIKGFDQVAMFAALPTSPSMPVYSSWSATDRANQINWSIDMKGLAAFVKDMEKMGQEAEKKQKATATGKGDKP